jgi:hypothetical protein
MIKDSEYISYKRKYLNIIAVMYHKPTAIIIFNMEKAENVL